MLPILIAIAAVLFLPLIYVIVIYNRLIGLRNHIRDAWADVDTELKRRHDLIPNLVETVRGYARHEQAVLARVVELRTRCLAPHPGTAARAADENELASSLSRLLALAEAYPQLRADEGFANLHRELVNTEDRIQAARRFFNGNIRDYRNLREQFPSSLVAGLLRFPTEEFFGVEPVERQTPSAGPG
jgi:LemA protein